MSKSTLPFNPAEYALVADRITAFYTAYPTGRIITKLVSRDRDGVFRASVYRSGDDKAPAATGWASEREGNGDINMYACLENTETSAIGRALANLGFTASLKRPSREEMQKVERARSMRGASLARVAERSQIRTYPPAPPPVTQDSIPKAAPKEPDALRLANEDRIMTDLRDLLDDVQVRGLPTSRVVAIRAALDTGRLQPARATRIETSLRSWLVRHAPA